MNNGPIEAHKMNDEGVANLLIAVTRLAARDIQNITSSNHRNRRSAEMFFKEDPYGLFGTLETKYIVENIERAGWISGGMDH